MTAMTVGLGLLAVGLFAALKRRPAPPVTMTVAQRHQWGFDSTKKGAK